MSKNRITHKYTLPPVYRILVIDDKLGKEGNIAWQNCFKACVKAKAEKVDIEIEYSKSVDDGFDKWLKNSYDLVLIDYDFTDTEKEIKKTDENRFSLSTIFPNRVGAGLFRFIRQLIDDQESDYYYKKERQTIYIWTSHRWDKKVNGEKEGVSIDLSSKDRAYFKKKDEWDIDKLCGEIKIDLTNWTLEYVLERLVSLSLSENKNNRLDGYVAFKKNGTKEKTLYSPLVDNELEIIKEKGCLYLLPYEPENGGFDYYCSIDKLQITRKLNKRLNGNDLRKALLGKTGENDKKSKIPEGTIRHSASFDEDSRDIKNEGKEYHSFVEFCIKKNNDSKKAENNAYPFAGVKLDSDIWLAATPLTTVTRPGKVDDVIDLLIRKLEAFFCIEIGAAVLKTSYYLKKDNKDNDIKWPEDHIQRYHRARVFDPILTVNTNKERPEAQANYQLWNTGKTALEAFPPEMMNKLLQKILGKKPEWENKVIVSLGSKITAKEKWDKLFEIVFTKDIDKSFPLVEINVRHFMRPLMEEYLGGDEYLAPMDKNKIHNYSGLFFEFGEWLKKLHSLGIDKKYKKKIILKFPFRSDIIPFLRIAEDVANIGEIDNPENYGISGVTLVNTVKSPYPYSFKEKPSDNDTIKIPQMSGEYLAWTRNYLLQKLKQSGFNLPVSVSGGVGIHKDDISYIRKNYNNIVKSIQIGTYFLKRIDSDQVNKLKNTSSQTFLPVSNDTRMKVRIIHLLKDKCSKCGNCYNSYYCDVFLNRGAQHEVPLMDLTACTGCGLCASNCPANALEMKNTNEYVILCCGFSEARFAILREEDVPFIHMETPDNIEEIKAFINTICEWKDKIGINHDTELTKLKNKLKNKLKDQNEIEALEKAYWRAMYQFYKCRKPAVDKDEVVPLEDCVYLGVKTYLEGKENKKKGYVVLSVINDNSEIIKSLKKYELYIATTAYVCIKKNKEIKIEGDIVVTKQEFKITSNFKKYNDDQIKSYSIHGISKAGGIDILGHGSILFGDLSDREGDVMTFAGLPKKAIETVKELTENK